MNNAFRWSLATGVLLLALLVGFLAFNAGVARGVEQSGKIVVAGPSGAAATYPVPYPYPYYGYWHPWGGSIFIPIFALLIFLSVVRRIFSHGHRYGRGVYGCGGAGERVEEWHRQMHERMNDGGSSGGTAKP